MDGLYKVYAKLDTNKCITGIWSTGNQALGDKTTIQEILDEGYVKIDEGSDGKIYGHAQQNYLKMKYGKPCYDDEMKCNYKLINGNITFLTEEDKADFYPIPIPQPSEQELINSQMILEIAKLKAGVK